MEEKRSIFRLKKVVRNTYFLKTVVISTRDAISRVNFWGGGKKGWM